MMPLFPLVLGLLLVAFAIFSEGGPGEPARLPALVLGFLLLGLSMPARAHSWYPYECCSEVDCRPIPIPATEIERTPEGWRVKRGGFVVPFNQARKSPDGQFHGCWSDLGRGALIVPAGKPPCLWAPESEG